MQKTEHMTEQPSNNQEPFIEKLQIDDPENFQFHTAYMVYSELFDNVSGDDAKKDLNLNIDDLKENKISPEVFYRNVSRYRGNGNSDRRRDRFTVQTQRKRDWRMKSQRQDRIRRHKK
ncbi:MAG: hypothetical protein NWF00_12025 [Candidatus Bathyarchaeota archaeon]|nr:hypothetical protein [Candidatus Bathyarchaeota archaeon]